MNAITFFLLGNNTQEIRTIYITISGTMFIVALVLQTTPKFLTDDYSLTRLIFFVSWSCFGFLPCIHWVMQNGGFGAPNVFVSISLHLKS